MRIIKHYTVVSCVTVMHNSKRLDGLLSNVDLGDACNMLYLHFNDDDNRRLEVKPY